MASLCSCLSCFADTEGGMLKTIAGIAKDPSRLAQPLDVAFKHFDKDKSGYIEVNEVIAVANFVCRRVGLPCAPTPAVNLVFDKVAGTDGRIDRDEFTNLLRKMFFMAEKEKQGDAGAATLQA